MVVLDKSNSGASAGSGNRIDGILKVVIVRKDNLRSNGGGGPRLIVGVGKLFESVSNGRRD